MWDHDLIAHETPRISNMTRTSKGILRKPATSVATSGLNRSILDAGWGVGVRSTVAAGCQVQVRG